MKSFSKKALVLGVMLAVGSAAQAAYLGQLRVTSQSSQNFQATFLVHDVSPTGTSLTARLAPADTYAKYGITMPESAKGLNLALINKSPLTLRITGNKPAVERAFPLLVELNEGGRITVRQYNIHVGATGTVEPVEVVAMGAAPVTEAKPVEAARQAPAAKPATVRAAQPVQSAKTEMTPLERMQSKNYDLSKPVLVEAGYTPWSLGVLYQKRYPNASVNQVLVALAIENPEAFPAGNVRQLKAGAKVTAPSAALVESINAQTAREIVQKGLSIDEVAQRPAPIKANPKKAERPAAVKTVKPVEQTKPEVTKPEVVTPVAEPVKTEPTVVPEVTPSTPAVETPTETVTPTVQSADTQTTPQSETTQAPVTDGVLSAEQNATQPEPTVQESMPTLEIMTDEPVPVEEESSSWFWYLLIVLMLGAAGFIYWRTKQGRYVDFQSFKNVMNKGRREEPQAFRQETPQVTQPRAVEPQPAATVETVKHEPVREEPRMAPRPAPVPEMPRTVEQTKTTQTASANVFDLVADDEPLQTPAPAQKPEKAAPAVDDHGMKDSLDMARSFISIGAKNEAIALLQEVLQKGSAADKAQAEALLKQVHERA